LAAKHAYAAYFSVLKLKATLPAIPLRAGVSAGFFCLDRFSEKNGENRVNIGKIG
jgi:hypothetical protein